MAYEKVWNDVPNFDVYTGSSALACHQYHMLTLKDLLVAHAGYTVIGSSDGTTYEYSGVTAGDVYSGHSTGAYDVWEANTDVRRAENGSAPGWCLLRSPNADFWLLLALVGSSDTSNNGFMRVSNGPFLLDADPLLNVPVVDAGSGKVDVCISDVTPSYYVSGATHRCYLSYCTDGSFFLAQANSARAYHTGLITVLKLSLDDTQNGQPLPYVLGIVAANGLSISSLVQFVFYYPLPGLTASRWCSPGFPDLYCGSVADKSIFVDLMPTTNYAGEVDPYPLYFYAAGISIYTLMTREIVGRVPDLFVCPQGLAEGDQIYEGGVMRYYVFANLLMVPGSTAPHIGA